MDPVKRKVISDLFLAPSVVLPIVGGLSAGMLSWAGGGVNSLTAAAMVGVFGGIGWMLTRIIFQIESITEDAIRFQADLRAKEERESLDRFGYELRADGDSRTQDYLTLLRSLHDEFLELSRRPHLIVRSQGVRDQVRQVFVAAVDQLRDSLRLWQLAQKLRGAERQKILADREKDLAEIAETIDQLRIVTSQFRQVSGEGENVDLDALREELETSIRIAKRTEDRLKEVEQPHKSYDIDSSSRE